MGKHRTLKQDKILFAFMKKHTGLARNEMRGDWLGAETAWIELTQQLNDAGPPIKDLQTWRRVWKDWKTNIINKIALDSEPLTRTEDTVAQIANLYAAVEDERKKPAQSQKKPAQSQKKPARSQNMSSNQSFEADNSVSQFGNLKGKHRTALQDKILIDFMLEHPDLARNVKGDRLAIKSTWMKLAQKLNSAGPPFKEPNEWKRNWMEWKCYVKKKFAQHGYDSITPVEAALAQVSNLCENLNNETQTFSDNEVSREPSLEMDEFLTDDSSKDSFSVEATNSYTISSKQNYNSVNTINETQPEHITSQSSFEELKDVKTIAHELQKLNKQIKSDSKRNEAKNNAFLEIGKQMCQLMSQHIKEQQRLNDVLEKKIENILTLV